MTGIELADIRVSFGKEPFIQNMSFKIPTGKIGVLLGLSGSGKSTLLKAISGIQRIDTGRIFINGREVTTVPIRERNVGYVPQQQLLFPSLSTFENIAYGLRARGYSDHDLQQRVHEVAEFVGISSLIERDPSSLSGGERQRVALARAIAPHPDVLLMDEPLSSLDTAERLKMALTLRRLIDELRITTLYVTHSPSEAEIMADTLVVINEGKLIQTGTYREIEKRPQSVEVAGLLGIPNIFRDIRIDGVSLEQYHNGRFYHIPPERIQFSEEGVPAKFIATSGTLTYIYVGGYILATTDDWDRSVGCVSFR